MDNKRIIAAIDTEIGQLQHARKVLVSLNRGSRITGSRGVRKKMSAAARRRISLAQKARWRKWKAAKK
jgi:hypothetical protein